MIQLSELSSMYISNLHHTEFANPKVLRENFKAKLEKHEKYKDTLAICTVHRTEKFQTCTVYNAESGTSDVVTFVYGLGSPDMVDEAGGYLHQMILDSFAKAKDLQWPPPSPYLGNMTDVTPLQLEKFLC